MAVDRSQQNGERTTPLVMVLTRWLPHFRRPVFSRLADSPDFDVLFVHSDKIPDSGTGLSAEPLPGSRVVPLKRIGQSELVYQPESVRLVKRMNPDVVLCEASPWIPTIALASVLQRCRGQGVIYWSKGPSPRWRRPISRWIRDRLLGIWFLPANVIVTYGQSPRAWFERRGIPTDRIVIAQNSVDTSIILNDLDGWRQRGAAFRDEHGLADRTVIAVVSRLIESKRVDTLIEAAATIAEDFPTLTLVIGGVGPSLESLRALARRYPHLDVRFLGKLPIGDDNTVFAASDVNVFPGAVGLAIIQTMSLGKPTICADEPFADAELVIHDKTGLRYPPGDAAALAEQIGRVLGDPDMARRLGREGQAHIVANATIENMVDRIADAIRLALRVRRRARRATT